MTTGFWITWGGILLWAAANAAWTRMLSRDWRTVVTHARENVESARENVDFAKANVRTAKHLEALVSSLGEGDRR